MATNTENVVDAVAIMEGIKTQVLPLVTGQVVEMSDEDKTEFSDFCRNLADISGSIRQAHDEWVKLEQEANKDTGLTTIRKPRNSDSGKSGFLKL